MGGAKEGRLWREAPVKRLSELQTVIKPFLRYVLPPRVICARSRKHPLRIEAPLHAYSKVDRDARVARRVCRDAVSAERPVLRWGMGDGGWGRREEAGKEGGKQGRKGVGKEEKVRDRSR